MLGLVDGFTASPGSGNIRWGRATGDLKRYRISGIYHSGKKLRDGTTRFVFDTFVEKRR